MSGGKASKREYAIAATIGALPVGLGVRGTMQGVSKLRKLHKFGKHYQPGVLSYQRKVMAAAIQPVGRFPGLSLRPEAKVLATGAAANYAVSKTYDSISRRGSGKGKVSSSRQPSTGKGGTSSPTHSRHGRGPQSSRRARRSVRRRQYKTRCTHRDKRGRRCLRPAGHSGRHRYK